MIEEVTELSGDASPLTPAPTEATDTPATAATDEKPKRRRVTRKSADAELPLEGVEVAASEAPAKPKRAVRKKKIDDEASTDAPSADDATVAADGEAAPAKPKRATRAPRAKKTETPAEETAISSDSKTDSSDTISAKTESKSQSDARTNEAPAKAELKPSDLPQQDIVSGPAPFQVAPAAAMGSFTPTETKSEETQSGDEFTARGRGNEQNNGAQTKDADGSDSSESSENGARNSSDESGDDDDFRGRLSYRDRRQMRREQRIVARGGRDEETETEGDDNRNTRNRDDRSARDNNRDNGRDNDNRGDRNTRDSSRDNDSRGGRDSDNRGDRNNRNNRNDRNNRNNRGDRNERNNNRNDREPREPRENRRERNGSRGREYDLPQLEAMDSEALQAVVAELNMEEAPGDKDALVLAILEAQAGAQNAILKKGILEILPDQKGFLRTENYYPSEGDVYVSQTQIKRFGLKTGDEVLGTARVPKENERYHGLLRVESINGLSIEDSQRRLNFDKLTPIFPTERFPLETDAANITARIIDLISPIGKGQRGLIVAPPKAGKTTLIKNIANSITENNPEVMLFVLLIDERPEEVTDISRSVRGEVVASTFDEVPENHIRVSDIVMERAKRLVEQGNDVVVLMDSITRLSRASNLVVAPSGRTMSGGLDPAAMYKPKRHFGAARNIEGGGSLTVLATVLVDTGSRMDEYIFEELKGTGNLDLVLDRDLFNQRIFPAIDINRSGTRRDDLLLNPEELAATFHLRRTLAALDNDKAVTLLIDRLKNTKSNANFMEVVAKSQRNAGPGS